MSGKLSCLSALLVALASVTARAEEAAAQAVAEPAPAEAPSVAEAEAAPQPSGPRTAGSLQLGIGFRYGALLSDGELNPWGTGLGLDGGYTLPNAIYLGGNAEYFFGETRQLAGLELSTNVWQLSAEGGYDIGLGDSFVIRPKVGLGMATLSASAEGCPSGITCESASDTKALLAPGAKFMLFTRSVSLAFDARYAIVLSDPSAKAFIFSVGVGF